MQNHTTSYLETENKRSFQWVLGGWDARHQEFRYFWGLGKVRVRVTMVTMVTIGGDLQPGCLADRLLTGLGQPQINP